jgi:RND family efflux transporter MFP subunit
VRLLTFSPLPGGKSLDIDQMKAAHRLISVIALGAVLLTVVVLAFRSKSWEHFFNDDELVVSTAEVKSESRPTVLRVSGRLQPATEIHVVSPIIGRVKEVKFKTGDTVNKGMIVATVHSIELTARMRVAEAELIAIKKQLQEREQRAADANEQLARQRELNRRELIARRDVEQAEIIAATARAELELLRAQIAQAEAVLTQTRKLQQLARITAPISGLVTGALSAGAPVNEATAVLTIAPIDKLKLVAAVPARYATLVDDGTTAHISTRGEVHSGKIVRMDGNVTTADGETPIEVRVDNHNRVLQLGTLVDATLTLKMQDQLTIPRAALQSAADRHYVYQIVDGRAVRRGVELEATSSEPAVIRAGLKAGDQVIVERTGVLKEGLRVRATAQAQ